MKRATLSVVLATFNEEKKLGATLESIKDIADEIVIVDGTSNDKTVEIAKKYKAIVKVTDNPPNFHINKQKAIDMATKDWILQLDADEIVSQEMKEEIRQILGRKSEFSGYWMPRKNWFLGRFLMKGGQYPDYTLRLYKRGKGRLPQKDVHEQAIVEGKVGYLKEALLHYPYENLKHYLRKWNKYNDLFAKQIEEEQKTKNIIQKIIYGFGYLILKPAHWLFTTFLRHKGFVDSWQGFLFSLFSALRFPVSYIKYLGKYNVATLLVILIAIILRFYNFDVRWGLGGDDARDAMIALEAIRIGELPLAGPFSSAGAFVFSGIYYWYIMASYFILPFMIEAPWVTTALLGVATVGVFAYIGKLIGGDRLAFILALLAAFSPQLVVRSLILGPHTYISTFTALLILFFILFWTRRRPVFAFLMGLSIGTALAMHYQAINLLVFFPLVLIVPKLRLRERLLAFFLLIIGFIIPSLPLLYWDSNQNFANIRNILDYFLVGQYRIYVPNSWKLYAMEYFPLYWSFVIGRFKELAMITALLSGVIFVIYTLRRKIPGYLFVLGIVFAFLFFLNRFYRGERSEGYLLYFLPFIVIFTGWAIDKLLSGELVRGNLNKAVRILTVAFAAILISSNLITIKNLFAFESPVAAYRETSRILSEKYPNQKFLLHDYEYKLYGFSMGLSFILETEGKASKEGIPIGIGCYSSRDRKCPPQSSPAIAEIANNPIYDLREYSSDEEIDWVEVSQEAAHKDLIGWLNQNQLKSNFDVKKYIMERLGL